MYSPAQGMSVESSPLATVTPPEEPAPIACEEQHWTHIAAQRRVKQLSQIPRDWLLRKTIDDSDVSSGVLDTSLTDEERAITEMDDPIQLLEAIASRQYTAESVARAYCKRAILAHQLVNCLTQIFVDRAIQRARELDRHYEETGELVGVLHGLPISLKEQIDIEGIEMSLGYVGRVGQVSKRNALLADILLEAGAVPFVRTNIPQGLVFAESMNNLFGKTLNPHNRALTSGGSSGGETALLAMKGSICGVGSDLGGSIRSPASFNGLYGLRPSSGRVPYCGASNTMDGQEAIRSVLGPMCRHVSGLKLFMKAIVDAAPWERDAMALRQPWSPAAYELESHGGPQAQLCFGVIWDDGFCRPTPPYTRALRQTVDAVLRAGHKVIAFTPSNTREGVELVREIYNADGGADIASECAKSDEPRIGFEAPSPHRSTFEWWQLCVRRREFAQAQLEHWTSTAAQTGTGRPIDAMLVPAAANAPGPHGSALPNSPVRYIYYTAWANLCDFTAAVLPVTRVSQDLDGAIDVRSFRSEVERAVHSAYEPSKHANAPIGVQVIGRRSEEEAVIRMTENVDAALRQ